MKQIKLTNIKLEFTESMIVLVILALLGIVVAQPGLPHQFYGNVNCQNNNAVPDNTQIDVKTNNTIIKSTKTLNNAYGYNPVFLIWGTEDDTQLDFYVNSKFINSTNFSSGQVTNFNLIIDNGICSSTGSGGGGGGGGGGSGGGITPIINTSNKTSGPIQPNTNPKPPIIQPSKKAQELAKNLTPVSINQTVALNISLFSLIIMALIAFYTLHNARMQNQKIYK